MTGGVRAKIGGMMVDSKRVKAHQKYPLDDGTPGPGITTVLGMLNKRAIPPWANRLGLMGIELSKYVDDKADIGTLSHAMCLNPLIGAETDTSDFTKNQIDSAENAMLSFLKWQEEHYIQETLWIEKPLVSNTHRCGGTADLYCKLSLQVETDPYRTTPPFKYNLIDLKTGKGIYPEHIYQVATLKHLLEENNYPVDEVRVLNIPRSEDEHFSEHVLTEKELETGWKIFYHCLQIYRLKKGEVTWQKKRTKQ